MRYSIPQGGAAPLTACTTTNDGAATLSLSTIAIFLLTGSGKVSVLADWNETGDVATCAAPGARQVATVVVVPGIAPAPPPSAGFAIAPVFSSGRLAQVVFNGGMVTQLDAALTAAGASGAWA